MVSTLCDERRGRSTFYMSSSFVNMQMPVVRRRRRAGPERPRLRAVRTCVQRLAAAGLRGRPRARRHESIRPARSRCRRPRSAASRRRRTPASEDGLLRRLARRRTLSSAWHTLAADDDARCGKSEPATCFLDPRLARDRSPTRRAARWSVRCSGGAAGEACAAFPRSASPILRAIATLYRQNSDESTASHVSSLESESRARTEASTAAATQYAQMRYTWSGASVSSRASSESAAEPSPREGPAETTDEAEEAGGARHRVDPHDSVTSEVAAATTHAGGRDARGVESRAHQVAAPQDDGCSRASWSASASLPVPAVVAQPACRESAKPDARSIAGFDVRSVSKSIRSTDSSDASIHLAALLPPSPRARGTVAPRLQQVAPFPRSFRAAAAADEPNSAENLRASFRKLAETRKRQMVPRAPSPVRAASDAGGPPAKMQSLARGAQDGPLPMETWSVEGEVKMELTGNESMRESFTDNATTIVGKTSVETDGTNDAVFLHPGPVKVERVHSWSRGRSLHGGRKQSNANRSHESLAALKYHLDVPGRGWTTGSGQNLSELTDAAPGDVGVRTHGRVAGSAVCFERLLEDPSGQQVFTDFLKKQFSVENIVFWNTVKDFKKTGDSNTLNVSDYTETHHGDTVSLEVKVPVPAYNETVKGGNVLLMTSTPVPARINTGCVGNVSLSQMHVPDYTETECIGNVSLHRMDVLEHTETGCVGNVSLSQIHIPDCTETVHGGSDSMTSSPLSSYTETDSTGNVSLEEGSVSDISVSLEQSGVSDISASLEQANVSDSDFNETVYAGNVSLKQIGVPYFNVSLEQANVSDSDFNETVYAGNVSLEQIGVSDFNETVYAGNVSLEQIGVSDFNETVYAGNVSLDKKNKEEDDRRRSLLPWHKVTKKNIKRTESDQFSLRSSRSSLEGAVGGWGSVGGGAVRQRSLASCADLHTMEKSASVASIASFTSRESLTSLGRLSNTGDLGVRLCRIRLPNGSTSVMPANPGA
ncbi:PREDICTED: uncharacterized protein LOC106813626 [Priapulus caudatus]|uniref:Uncharacterized protein LOC106813626 n=1 Tax=Priapulus caudatus TaxID=37621 RepID=A0ABM1EM76_PRICU|nr:PREDICTED: uncharacterized protein LOC106813626 [Priapulus caudatus]